MTALNPSDVSPAGYTNNGPYERIAVFHARFLRVPEGVIYEVPPGGKYGPFATLDDAVANMRDFAPVFFSNPMIKADDC